MYSCDVVIIDSGFDVEMDPCVTGISIDSMGQNLTIGKDLSDKIGHGTIIFTIIRKQANDKKYFLIKMPDNNGDSSSLIFALEYVKENVKCKFINMSLGIKTCDDLHGLYSICKELKQKGVVIVSAFDNEGCIAYPAAFDCVIGVDSKTDFKTAMELDYVEDSYVNVLAKGNIQRLRLNSNQILFVGGASIACAYVTGMLASADNEHVCFDSSLEYLKKKARFIYKKKNKVEYSDNKYFSISNAVVFPFSKESQAFLRFAERLSFKIKGYYDVRYSGKVGRKLTQYYEGARPNEVIMDIDQVQLDGIDTVIIGHLEELNKVLGKNYLEQLVKVAIDNKINIVSFDPLTDYVNVLNAAGVKYYYPYVDSNSIEKYTFGKLFKISKPVVCIFGTSSQQGKFSLQNSLISVMEKAGYNVGSIGTEPHSLLFGYDVVFPMGYNSSVYLQNNEIVLYLNEQISKMCFSGKEIIIASSQAQTIPYYFNNILEFPPMQSYFAFGIHPDAIVLCVNYHDEVDYIKNTLYALKGLTDAEIVALVVYPITRAKDWNGVYGNSKYTITEEEFKNKASELEEVFHMPVYLLGNKNHLDCLCKNIIDYF